MAKKKIARKPARAKQTDKPEPPPAAETAPQRFRHLPDRDLESAALRESYQRPEHTYSYRLRDLIAMGMGATEASGWEYYLTDPDEYRESDFAYQALDSLADEIDAVAAGLVGPSHGVVEFTERQAGRMLVRLAKRARACAEIHARFARAGITVVPSDEVQS